MHSTLFALCALALALALAAAPAAAAQSCRTNPSTVFFKVGDITAQVTSDGPLVSDTNGFAVPRRAVEMAYALLRRSTTPAVLSLNVVLLHLPDGKRVLIETGSPNVPFPDFARAGQLPRNLRASGVAPQSIDAVILTHGHFDHVAGLVDAIGHKTFPNARVLITATEHAIWGAEPFVSNSTNLTPELAAAFSAIYKRSIAPYARSDMLTLVHDGATPFAGVSLRVTPGHAPGHAVVRVESRGRRLFVTGDAWVSQADHVRHPEWAFFSEYNTTQAFLSRVELLDELAASGDLVVPYHEPFPGIGSIIKTAYGFDWVPAPSEMLGTVSTVCDASK